MTIFPSIAQLLKDAPTELSRGGNGSVIIVLFLLLVGVSFAVWLFLKRGGFPRIKNGEHLEILETRALGGRQFIVVAKHHDQKFLLGVCPGRIDYLCSLEYGPDENPPSSFDALLAQEGPKDNT